MPAGAVADRHPLGSRTAAAPLPEREHVRLGAGLQEPDFKGPFAERVVLAHELVQAAVGEHAVPVGSMSTPCDGPGAWPSRSARKGIGSRAPGDSIGS